MLQVAMVGCVLTEVIPEQKLKVNKASGECTEENTTQRKAKML